MIPIRDTIPSRNPPVVVWLLMVTNSIVFLDVDDSEAMIRAIHMTDPELPLDLILHTPDGALPAAGPRPTIGRVPPGAARTEGCAIHTTPERMTTGSLRILEEKEQCRCRLLTSRAWRRSL